MFFFMKTPCFQNFALLVGGDVFFLHHPVEEGEGEDGNGCCTPDVQEFICRGTSVLVMGSSRKVSLRDEAWMSGRIGRTPASLLACMVFDQIGLG